MAGRLNLTLPICSLQRISMVKLGISFLYSALETDVITSFEANTIHTNYRVLLDRSKDVIPDYLKILFDSVFYSVYLSFRSSYVNAKIIYCKLGTSVLPPKEVFPHFRFTPRGMVDSIKTYQSIVHDENFQLLFRFHLACNYYLEESIRALWKRVKPEDIPKLKNSNFYRVKLWSLKMLGLENEMVDFLDELNALEFPEEEFLELSLNALIFHRELRVRDEYGAKYFFEKLNQAEIMAVFDSPHMKMAARSNRMYFSFLSRYQLEKVLEDPDKVRLLFSSISEEPFNELIPRIFDSVWSFVDEESYFHILMMTAKMCNDNNGVHAFELLWSHSQVPDSYRDYVLNKPGKVGAASLLRKIYNSSSHYYWRMLIVLRCASSDQLDGIFVGLLESLHGCMHYAYRHSHVMELLKICAQKMIYSKVDLVEFRKTLSPSLNWEYERSWEIFLENVKVLLENVNQRKPKPTDAVDEPPAKKPRLCTIEM